jgi:hypothetical protein
MPNLSYALWSIWIELPLLHKMFLLLLFVVGVYSSFSATKILAGVRSVRASGQSRVVPAFQNEVAALYARSASMRHLITATFYLFGIVFFWGCVSLCGRPTARLQSFNSSWRISFCTLHSLPTCSLSSWSCIRCSGLCLLACMHMLGV